MAECGSLCEIEANARPQCGDREDYEEGGGESDTIINLLHFSDNKNWLGSLVGGQSDELVF